MVTLDHLFVCVPEGAHAARARLSAVGLVQTRGRAHPGQGTANVCFAFDNACLELLWLRSDREVDAPHLARTGLGPRLRGGNPFGFAWRGDLDLPCWDHAPDHLPEGATIPMSLDSDDPSQPLVFRSPGTDAPADWPEARRGVLQRPVGLVTLGTPVYAPRQGDPPGPGVRALAEAGVIALAPPRRFAEVEVPLHGPDRRLTLRLPSFDFV